MPVSQCSPLLTALTLPATRGEVMPRMSVFAGKQIRTVGVGVCAKMRAVGVQRLELQKMVAD